MLYLARKIGESIVIDNNIEITITSISKNIVKLGLTFPSSCLVLRKEVHDKIAKENVSASSDKQNIEIKTLTLKKIDNK